ncbi:peroxidase [Rhizobiales bacterium L72]|uniref:Peroxidase n=2 Tax=Propylenella binzhouense TaxID=2555902 RepID=A0A964T414_9HYPH|nr:peroxidase [Propylenella binzhouense]
MVFTRGMNPPQSRYYNSGRFGRLFPTLPPQGDFQDPTMKAALSEVGEKGGIMDGGGAANPDNPAMPSGITFLGQFLDHDITFDPTSSLERQQDPEAITNFRTPAFELDSVYGSGPGASPHLYDQTVEDGRTTMLVEAIPGSEAASNDGTPRFDVPRNGQNTAILGDPRNDENLIISQLHLAILKFHNATLAAVPDTIRGSDRRFEEAQRLVRWHYQWIILHEFLPLIVGAGPVEAVLSRPCEVFDWDNLPFIPAEFSVATYRFGHSLVRPGYRANFGPPDGGPFAAPIFNDPLPPGENPADPNDLRGGRRAARRFVDWQSFFDFGDGNLAHSKKIDTVLSGGLFDLPGIPAGEPQSLAQRNLMRGLAFGLPSGQAVARYLGLDPLSAADLADIGAVDPRLAEETPLWFYILREAAVQTGGERLGEVGGRIVAEVFVGLLQGDRSSYLRQHPKWRPDGGAFRMADLLTMAGVVGPVPPTP